MKANNNYKNHHFVEVFFSGEALWRNCWNESSMFVWWSPKRSSTGRIAAKAEGEVWIEGCPFCPHRQQDGWLETEGLSCWLQLLGVWMTCLNHQQAHRGSTSKGEEIRRKHCRLVSSHLCRQLTLKMKEHPQSIVWPISYLRKNFRFGRLSGNIPGLSLILKTWHFFKLRCEVCQLRLMWSLSATWSWMKLSPGWLSALLSETFQVMVKWPGVAEKQRNLSFSPRKDLVKMFVILYWSHTKILAQAFSWLDDSIACVGSPYQDRMLDMGFEPQIRKIISGLPKECPDWFHNWASLGSGCLRHIHWNCRVCVSL